MSRKALFAAHERIEAENPVQSKQVFVSYGRSDALDFVKRLAVDLRTRGCEVWVDLDSIEKGGVFDVRIEQGIRASSLVVAVLTPSSVSENSVCRKEIIFALNEGKHIIPLLAQRAVKPSLMLADLNWIDFTQEYEPALLALLRFLDGEDAASLPPLQTTVTGIPPLDFGPEIARYAMTLSGRDWLRHELDQWLADRREQMMVIVGEPGVGKSAVATWLSQNCSAVIHIHFCTARNTRSLDPIVFVATLVGRLHAQVPGFAETAAKRDPRQRRPTASDEFRELVVLPSREMATPPGTQIVIVDSLDESVTLSGETILDVLAQQAGDLPEWLRIVATTRPEERVLERTRELHAYEMSIDPHGARNASDIQEYLGSRFQTAAMAERWGSQQGYLRERVEILSAGNFLYAKLVLDGLECGSLSASDLGQLDPGLSALYGQMFRRRFPDLQEYLDDYAPLLRVLAAARGPLPYLFLKRSSGQQEESVRLRLRDLSTCLRFRSERGVPVYSLFHRSFVCWLTDASQAGPYFVSIEGGQACLANLGWEEFELGASQLSGYMVAHLAIHLAEVNRWDDLLALLSSAELALLPQWVDRGEIETGLTCLKGLIDHLEKNRNEGVKAAAFSTRLAQLHVQRGAYEEAERVVEYALRHTSRLRGRRERAIALHELGSLHLYRGKYELAEKAYHAALSLCLYWLPVYQDEAAANLVGLATVCAENFRFEETLSLSSRAARKARAGKDTQHLIAAKRLIASAYRGMGSYSEASAEIDAALALCLVSGARIERTRLLAMKGWLQYDLATLEREEPSTAVVTFREYQDEVERIHNYYGILEAKLSLGWCALVSNNTRVAGDNFSCVRESLLPDQHFGLWAGCKLGLAAIMQQQSDLPAAVAMYEEVVNYCSERRVTAWMAKALVGVGAAKWHLGFRPDAEATWQKALRAVGEISAAKQVLIQASIDLCKESATVTPR